MKIMKRDVRSARQNKLGSLAVDISFNISGIQIEKMENY